MKLFINTISLLIFIWSINVESLIIIKDKISQTKNSELVTNFNNDFNGLWVNEEGDQTKMITKCNISYKNKRLVVQMWGACVPQDCDWGENTPDGMEKVTNKFEIIWDHEFAESDITYEIIDGKLKMTHTRRYKDNSGRTDSTLIEYFMRE